MSPETRYRIDELEQLTGLSRRLIYDYISRELVPAAMGSGKGAYYLQEHHDRLRLISLLRTAGFRLERIEEALKSWDPEEIARIVDLAEGRDVDSLNSLNEWLSMPRSGSSDPVESLALLVDEDVVMQDLQMEIEPVVMYEAANIVAPSPAVTSPRRAQSWERVEVSPDVEINYRSRRDADLAWRVAELVAFAEELFRESPRPAGSTPARPQGGPQNGMPGDPQNKQGTGTDDND